MVDHYYTEKPASRLIPHEFKARLRGNDLTFHTGSGVFSIKHVDRGSELLVEGCMIEDGMRVLDLACGYGPVGISLMKAFDISVIMTDINERALRFARKNIEANGLLGKDIRVKKSDIYASIEGGFDTILVNPPQNAGKDICIRMIDGAPEHLKDGGTLQLVARHQKGGKSLAKRMEEVFGNVEELKKGSGFRVYMSRKG
jgi:16S rRNA (guanine1207-N2)-methyltransferase